MTTAIKGVVRSELESDKNWPRYGASNTQNNQRIKSVKKQRVPTYRRYCVFKTCEICLFDTPVLSPNFVRFCSGKKQCLSQAVYFNISAGNFWPNYPFNNCYPYCTLKIKKIISGLLIILGEATSQNETKRTSNSLINFLFSILGTCGCGNILFRMVLMLMMKWGLSTSCQVQTLWTSLSGKGILIKEGRVLYDEVRPFLVSDLRIKNTLFW